MKVLKKSSLCLVVLASVFFLPAYLFSSEVSFSVERLNEKCATYERSFKMFSRLKRAAFVLGGCAALAGGYAWYKGYFSGSSNAKNSPVASNQNISSEEKISLIENAVLQKTVFGIATDGTLKDLCRIVFLISLLNSVAKTLDAYTETVLINTFKNFSSKLSNVVPLSAYDDSRYYEITKSLHEIHFVFCDLVQSYQTPFDVSYKIARLNLYHRTFVYALEDYMATLAAYARFTNNKDRASWILDPSNGVITSANAFSTFLADAATHIHEKKDILEQLNEKISHVNAALNYMSVTSENVHDAR